MKNPKNVRRGRRARQRGAELQRQAVRMAKEAGLEAFNRDRGGAQHEQGDIEIEGQYFGCKRRKQIAVWMKQMLSWLLTQILKIIFTILEQRVLLVI